MTAMSTTTAADRTPPTTPTPGGAALRHPDDPRPLAEAFDRCYPVSLVDLMVTEIAAIQNSQDYAPWHLSLDQWWRGPCPLRPLDRADRWEHYRREGTALLRSMHSRSLPDIARRERRRQKLAQAA
jgi:hypothetical protein